MTVSLGRRIGAWSALALVGAALLFGAVLPVGSAVSERLAERDGLRARVAELAARREGEPALRAAVERSRAAALGRGVPAVPDAKADAACEAAASARLAAAGLSVQGLAVEEAARSERLIRCRIEAQAAVPAPDLARVLAALDRDRAALPLQRVEIVRSEDGRDLFALRLRGVLRLFADQGGRP